MPLFTCRNRKKDTKLVRVVEPGMSPDRARDVARQGLSREVGRVVLGELPLMIVTQALLKLEGNRIESRSLNEKPARESNSNFLKIPIASYLHVGLHLAPVFSIMINA